MHSVWSGSPSTPTPSYSTVQIANQRVVIPLDAMGAFAHVVVGPPATKFLALHREFTHQLDQLGIVGMTPGVQAQGCHVIAWQPRPSRRRVPGLTRQERCNATGFAHAAATRRSPSSTRAPVCWPQAHPSDVRIRTRARHRQAFRGCAVCRAEPAERARVRADGTRRGFVLAIRKRYDRSVSSRRRARATASRTSSDTLRWRPCSSGCSSPRSPPRAGRLPRGATRAPGAPVPCHRSRRRRRSGAHGGSAGSPSARRCGPWIQCDADGRLHAGQHRSAGPR